MPRVSLAIALSLSIVVAAGACRSRSSLPVADPSNPVPYERYERLLSQYLDASGQVDYERWHQSADDVRVLGDFVASLAARPPDEQATTKAESLAYWMNLYNALVMYEVLKRWPLDSVRSVRAGLLNGSKGFFKGLTYRVGKRDMSLDDIEHRVIREQFSDARIHFALNCGAKSCPPLRPLAFSAGKLDEMLVSATRDFLGNRANLRIDHDKRSIRLSKLFDWYEDDFVAHANRARKSKNSTVVDFISLYAAAPVARELAKAKGYQVRFNDYDWSVNRGEATRASPCAPKVGARLPTLSSPAVQGAIDWQFPRARPLVVDVWASYCKPCRKTLPALQELATRHPGIDFVALSIDDEAEMVQGFLRDVPLSIPVALGGEDAEEALAVKSLPTLLIVDRGGVVRHCFAGVPEHRAVEEALAGLAAANKPR